jgi:hypothetical protein
MEKRITMDYNNIPFKNLSINRLIKTNREVTRTPEGKHVEIDKFNKLTGKGVSKEKDITFRTKESPREVYTQKMVVKRDNDLNWKSKKESQTFKVGGKKIRSESSFDTYDK